MPSITEWLFGRRGERRAEERALTPSQMWGADYWPDNNPSGEHVTQRNSTTLVAVYACQTLIADMVSTLPVDVMRDAGGYPAKTDRPGWLDLPVPNDPSITRAVHFNQVAMSLVADGNAFVHAAPHVMDPQVLTVLDPTKVQIEYRAERGLRPIYRVVDRAQSEEFTADNIIHIPRTIRPGEDRGLSPIDETRSSLGTYMAATKHSGRFYRNGALMTTVLEVPGEMSPEDAKAMREAFDEAHTGDNVFKTGVLTGGAKATTLGVTPAQAEFLDTLKHGTIEACRMFRVPPMLVGVNEPGTVSYASSVEAVKAFARNTLAPLLKPIELAYGRFLEDGQYLRFDMNGLLRADPEARYAGYAIGVDKGFINRDDIRAWEELPPVGGKAGKMFTVQAQMVDLALVADPPPAPTPLMIPSTTSTKPSEDRYSPDQPRVPAGNPTGGQFADATPGWFATYRDEYDAMAAFADEAQARRDRRSPAEDEAVATYQSSDWQNINDPLRSGAEVKAEYRDDMAHLDQMMAGEGGVPFDMYLYRGIDNTYGWLPEASQVGNTIVDKAYVSTTPDRQIAESFATTFDNRPGATIVQIRAREGQPGVVADDEIILPPGTALKVTLDKTVTQPATQWHGRAITRVIHAEIVP
jgi:HK97 family phage portal protein